MTAVKSSFFSTKSVFEFVHLDTKDLNCMRVCIMCVGGECDVIECQGRPRHLPAHSLA